MELALLTFEKIIAMFIILIIGVLCYKLKFISIEGNKSLSSVLLFVVNPVIIFMSFQRDYEARLIKNFCICISFTILAQIIGIVISNVFFRKKSRNYEINRFSAVYSNCGFIGIPIVSAILGVDGVFYLAGYMLAFNVLLWTHGYLTITNSKCDMSTVKTILTTPVNVCAAIGIVMFFLHIKLPATVADGLNYIGDMNTPLAMILAGATIAQANPFKALKDYKVYIVCILKLLVIPILTAILLCFLPGDSVAKMVCVVATACPVAASVTLFAIRYNKNAVYGSQLYAITTILSIITLPVVVRVSQLLIK